MSPVQILAVDDQISSLIALEDVLSDIDANLIKATSAKEALLVLLQKNIDCVLLDVSMPEMDGFEFLKTIRNAPAHAKIPVIMITGKIFSENETLRAYKYGAVDFLLKPLDSETVFRKVDFIVQQARQIKSIQSLKNELDSIDYTILKPLTTLLNIPTLLPEQQNILTESVNQITNLHKLWRETHDESQTKCSLYENGRNHAE